ncbi:GntR family transcriptional regulator [Salisediminibacterium halotolerans]|uniref:GntR family transcriptional regulator n=1 Tax=Salisediminibacterium halotolerans TaxID=517425 RepID=UPI000EAF246E|nr:GntR family transcriptional regulator [Salisediminibacterium halotolerans]RLJ74428.1 GntR family transcriptional regulator [Actinophytocola xinjiangensis]RPE87479.1 GntR family transcriptional regulator [Salisediminibacterium halotolerans]TWG35264.1 GntR family transcriptional regulator [Salisediminibacterium halotolerans]GEL06745.1 GntR family transcriptional regulator [Salisediminibacterium halotolerans]
MIDKQSPIPIYFQLVEKIQKEIEQAILKPGDVLPSEREYADTYDISRMTVRQAITKLVNDGYVHRKKGTGTFVNESKIDQPLQGLTSFTEDMRERGFVPSNRMLSFQVREASDYIAGKLNIALGAQVYEIERIRLADDQPMALETTWVPCDVITGLTEEVIYDSLYNYIESKLGLAIGSASQVIESSIVNEREMNLLSLPEGAPVLLIERMTFLADGRPFEFVKSRYRADRYRFRIQMSRS